MYTNKVMEIFLNPVNVGELRGSNGVGVSGSEALGDMIKLYISVNDKEIIEDSAFKAFGGAATIASGSAATQLIVGKSVDSALTVTSQNISDFLGGLPDQKANCAILAQKAIADAIKNYKKRK